MGAAVSEQALGFGRSKSRVSAGILLGVAGLAAAAFTGWAVSHSPDLFRRTEMAFFDASDLAILVCTGAYIWWRQPASRLGPLVAGLGFLYVGFSLSASANAVVFTLGMVVWAAIIVGTAYVYLSFPSGQLESRLERWFMGAFALSMALLWVLILALSRRLPRGSTEIECGERCPSNAFQLVSGRASTEAALDIAVSVLFTIALIGLVMLIFNKARSPSRMRRQLTTPLAAVLIVGIAEFAISINVIPEYPSAKQAFVIADYVTSVAVPVALLIGLAWARAYGTILVGRAAIDASNTPMTPIAAQRMIADALGDPSLKVALWAPERDVYLDVRGEAIELPPDTEQRRVTRVVHNGGPFAALIHAPMLEGDSDVVEALAASSLMHLENGRLVDEVRASRTRIVEAAERERKHLEQDLHDGAQQRLIGLQLRLQMARELVDGEDDLEQRLDATTEEAEAALEELRALAHGVYPTVLGGFGLAPALRELASSSSIPIEVSDEGIGRSSEAIEAAIYFCAREAIQNAAKHAGRKAKVNVTLARRGDASEFAVSDDGIGMPPGVGTRGLGLVGMRDRIEAVEGEFEIVSAPGQGTTVRGRVPDPGGQTQRK